MAGSLFLALFLVSCGGGDSEAGSAESSSAATRPILELTTADEEESSEVASEPTEPVTDCEPTQPDMLGPYYVPDAPVRTSVDTGYVTLGQVLSADGCEPIPGAQIEFWLADSQGIYDDAHRATMLAGEGGEYRFQSNFPGLYENRPPHIHVRVTAPGYEELVTQHYPEAGQTEAIFDLVLVPA
jgi:protocatechuate 3,4-dioxygenase beta subunit